MARIRGLFVVAVISGIYGLLGGGGTRLFNLSGMDPSSRILASIGLIIGGAILFILSVVSFKK
jgi:hypothetical protein